VRDLERAAIGLAIVAALVGYALHEARQTGIAVGRAEVAAREVVVRSRAVAKADTVYRDSLRVLNRWRDRWDTVRVRDTLVVTRNDTAIVYVPRAVADSTIRACFAVLRTCEDRVWARDSLIVSLRASIPPTPSRLRVWGERALFVGAGVGIGAIVRR
jgi:hypothetical protein